VIDGSNILLGLTGSIAAYKAADLVVKLKVAGASVRVIMTESAQKFVTPLTLETLSRQPVITGMWERTQYPEPVHIDTAEWADLLVVAPASANFIGKLAHGIADDSLTCMALAVPKPPLIAPAMNDNMYRHPAVQENIRILTERGCSFVGPAEGRLASGKIGLGRLAPLDEIFDAIDFALNPPETV
jgi:phosphopantothenoylcysteine decarboxylase / phosphopantothenate---cysteine ligase